MKVFKHRCIMGSNANRSKIYNKSKSFTHSDDPAADIVKPEIIKRRTSFKFSGQTIN